MHPVRSDDYSDDSFSDPDARSDFVRKVYAILTVQLIVTVTIICLFLYIDVLAEFADDHKYLIWVFSGMFMVLMMTITCFETPRRTCPWNLILLILLTLVKGLLCAFISTRFETNVVLIAIGTTALICCLISLVAWIAPCDITGCGMMLCMLSVCLLVFGLISTALVLILHFKILILVYSGLAVALFCLYLIYDTQRIIGGRRIELSPDEYILGAIQLYADVMGIFLNMLSLVKVCFRRC